MQHKLMAATVLGSLLSMSSAMAAVSVEEAEKLKTTLTPFGAERAGNADGTIPAWEGVYTKAIPGSEPGVRLADPFADEKPLLSITAENMEQYADKLSEGQQAMLKRYPQSYRLDIYPTHRTAGAPQWVYDNTYQNALRGKMVGDVPENVFGGVPFPIPQSGAEIMWNHLLKWGGESYTYSTSQYQFTAAGQRVLISKASGKFNIPYYSKDGSVEEFSKDQEYLMTRLSNTAPPIQAGGQTLLRFNLNSDKDQAWTYLLGQRRVRKIPTPCCETPSPTAGGLASIDETQVWNGRLNRFDWKILGKREMYIPYNSNRLMQPADDDEVLGEHHLNPDHVRWELHRVWVVEANLREGERHVSPRSRYYCDEDTWICMLGDRWDSHGQLWKAAWMIPIVIPELPGLVGSAFGSYDLLSGSGYASTLMNEGVPYTVNKEPYKEVLYRPESMAGAGIR